MQCIDLTLSDDERPAPPRRYNAKRERPEPASSGSSDVVVVVEDEAETKRQRVEPAAAEEALGDEEIAVVGETGQTALRDFPHTRDICCVNPFVRGVQQNNSKLCPQCFCLVCDDKASKCEFWGTGLRARDHCNAHDSSYWNAVKKKKDRKDLLKAEFESSDPQLVPAWTKTGSSAGPKSKVRYSTPSGGLPGLWARHASNTAMANTQAARGPAAATLTPPAAAAAAGGPAGPLAGQCSSTATPATDSAAAATLKSEAKQQNYTPKVPASAWLEKMPHPRNSKAPVQLLATLELPIKTTKGLTIAELQRRLVPTGFYKGMKTGPPEYGDHICLDNIAESRYVASKRKQRADFIQLLPLVPPAGLPQEPSRMRTWKFIVISHEAGAKPVAVAVTVEHECSLSAITTAIREQLGSSISETDELMIASHHPGREWHWVKTYHPDETSRTPDERFSERYGTHFVFKVPKAAIPAPPEPNATGQYVPYRPPLKLAVIMHEKTVPPEQEMSPDSDGSDSETEYMRMIGMMDEVYGRTGSNGNREKPERFGLPQIVVMEPSWQKGGLEADKRLRRSVISQLEAYCRPDQIPSMHSWSFTINRYSAKDTWRLSGSQGLGRLASQGNDIEYDYEAPGVGKLYVHWGSEPIVPPAGFDMEAFKAMPQVLDDSAKQRLADMPKVLADWSSYQHELRMLKQMPSEVIMELKAACAAAPPPKTAHAPVSSAYKPAAVAVLSVVPAHTSDPTAAGSSSSSSTSTAAAHVAAAVAAVAKSSSKRQKQYGPDRLGVLRVEVYVFKRPGHNHRLIAEDYEDWSSDCIVGTGRNRACLSGPGNQLKSVLNARLLQEPDGYQLLKEINDLARADVRGIKKLMDWVVTSEREAAEQPPGLTVQMHPYQLQSLKFMQDAEKAEGGWRQLFWKWLPHQLHQQGALAAAGSSTALQTAQQQQGAVPGASSGNRGQGVWWSPVLERVSYAVPGAPWGGFLAEEMGLGKTVEVLGLVLSNPAPPSVISGSIDAESGKIKSRGTLVVCAVSLVGQWCQEAQKKLAGSLVMYPYHGQSRTRDPMRLATQYDLVVTTYATLGSDYGKNGSGTRNPLHKIKWHRVVFDEGHTVKNPAVGHSKACAAITADRRWICTGTPLSNDITDLLGQFSVLHMEPFSSKSWFDARVKTAFLGHGYGQSLIPLLHTLKHTMIRHTKAQTISGQSVLALPEKTEELVPVVLSERERSAYMEVHNKAAALWAQWRTYPAAAINQKLLQIMALLGPLRRICSGGSLLPSDLSLPADLEVLADHASHMAHMPAPSAAPKAAGQSVNVQEDNTLHVPDAMECPICLDSFETPVMTSCHHWFCKECILGVMSASSLCPLCRGTVDTAGLRAPGKNNEPTPVITKKTKRRRSGSSSDGDDESNSEDELPDDERDQPAAAGVNAVHCDSKLKALVAELRAMRAADSSSKALVFSQYNSTLDWLKTRLPQEGFSFRTITGSMAQRQRAKAIDAFQSDPPTTVFLLSMRSGAVGINLTAASHVFMLEPCINPALEEQAIGRAWRMGQTRKVVVKRFYVKGSVEERIMDVRAMRQGHATPAAAADGASSSAAAAAANDDGVVRTGKGRKSIIGASAIAGNLKADRQVLKIAELDLLFRTPELDSGAGSSAAAAAAAAGR